MESHALSTLPDAPAAGARSVFYHGLAVLFQHPDRDWAGAASGGKLFSALREAAESLQRPGWLEILARIEAEFARHERSPQDLSVDYVRLFGVHGGINCPPLATEFGERHIFSKGQDLADINGFYRAFGLATSKDTLDRPDHISFLFEFLSFLSLKQVDAIAEDNQQTLTVTCDAEKKFFCNYVINWVPVFCDTLAAAAHQAYYSELALLTGQFVEAEENRWGVHVERISIVEQQIDPDEDKCPDCLP